MSQSDFHGFKDTASSYNHHQYEDDEAENQEDDEEYWTKSSARKNMTNNAAHNQIGMVGSFSNLQGMDNSSSVGSSTSFSSSAITNPQSPILSLRNSLFEFIISYRRSETLVKNKIQMIGWIFLHAYMMYFTLVTSSIATTVSEESSGALWGVIGGWIWRGLHFPLDFGLQFYPYELVYTFSVVGLALELVCILTFYANVVMSRFGNSMANVKSFSRLLITIIIFLSPFLLFVHSYPLAVEMNLFSSASSTGIYLKHFTSPLFSSPANIGLVVVSGIGIICVLTISGFGIFMVAETIPSKGSKTFFISDRIYPLGCLLLNNQFGVVFTTILTYELCVVSSSLKFLMTVVYIVSLFVAVPFYRRWENCFYCGIGFARALGCLGPLVCFVVARTTGSTNYEYGGGAMTGITLAAMILGFIIGYVIMEIYTRWTISSIRKELKSFFGGMSVINIVSELTSKKLIRNVTMLLRFNSLSTDNSEESDRALAIKFIRAANVRSTSSVDLLIAASCFVVAQGKDFDNGTIMAVGIMRRVLRHSPSFVQLFHFYLRSKEIEVQSQDGDSVSFEVQKTLEKLEKRQAKIINLHQDFFKELSSENPSENKLEEINRQSHHLTQYCENTYKNTMSSNLNNKTLMRAYAHFLESFKFEVEMAAELFEEANQIEEEKSKSNKKKHTENRVLPYTPSTSQFKKSKSTAAMKNTVSFDEVVDNWDSISARMEETMREEAFYRSSINIPEHRKSFFMLFLPFIVISILIIMFMLILSLVVSSEFTSRTALEEKICSIAGAPSIMANHIRSLQARYRYLNETTAGGQQILATIQANYVLSLVQGVMSSSTESFFPSITDSFVSQKWLYKIPNKQLVGESTQVYSTMNVSVLDFITMYSNQAPYVISQFSNPSQLNNTATNFPVLFFLYNRETMAEAFDGFCQYFLTFSMERAEVLSQVFLWSSGVMLGCYLVLIAFYISMLSQYFVQIRQIIYHIFRKIQKDEVGKLYHSLKATKTGDYGDTVVSPKTKIIIYTTITFFVVALVSPIQIYEFQLNKQNQFVTMKTAASVNNVLSSVTSVNYKLTEMIIGSNMSDYTPEELHLKNQRQLMNITLSWSYAIRGAPELGYTNSLFGKYTDLDKLLAYKCDANHSMVNYTSGEAYDIIPDSIMKTRVGCYGLEKLVYTFLDLASESNEDFFTGFYSKPYDTDHYFTYLYYPALVAVQLIYDFTSTYVKNTKTSEDYLAIISTILGTLAVILFGWLSYLSMMDLFKEIQSLRVMLNYVPKDVVDMIPDMIDYILNYRVPSTAQKLKKIMKKRNAVMSGHEVDDENMDMTRSILNSGVDGSVICNPKGDIVMFNPASEDMFGYKKEEILGVRLETLFSELNVDKISVLIDSMKVCTEETALSADSFEVTGLRKNKTTFPAFVSISISQYLGKPILSCFVKDVTQLKKHSLLLADEKKKSEELLLNILPLPVANRLKQGETYIAEKFPDVTIFFSDMVGFTKMSSGMEADQLVMMLNTIVNEFDKLTEKYLIDKIKTIGDAYFAVAGTHSSKSSDHPERMLKFAISVYSFLRDFNIKFGKEVNLRIGMHTGPCVGGVIGTKKFAYDLWGDTINTASRMESTGVPGRIQISRATYERVFDLGYEFEERESIYVKGKGEMKTYLLKDKYHANPLPTVQEIQQQQQLENELLADTQSPTMPSESPTSDELTVLKLNQNLQNQTEITNLPSTTISPSNHNNTQ